MTREQAIEAVGLAAVEAVEAKNCEPTGLIPYNGRVAGDAYTQWSSSVDLPEDEEGHERELVALYYTTNEQDKQIQETYGDGTVIDWVVDEFLIR